MAASDNDNCAASAAAAAAADIICSLRAADLAGWMPPWCRPPKTRTDSSTGDGEEGEEARELIWPAVARGKRSRRRSPVPAAAAKGKWARASPASPLDYSGGSGSRSGSAASTSGGEDGVFCSPPEAAAGGHRHAVPVPRTKVGPAGRRPTILPVPPPRPTGQRPRKKMRLPEIQQLVRSLTVENEGLREEMRALQRACTALSKENGKLEVRLEQSSKHKGKQQLDQHAVDQSAQNGFVLPDLNLPVQDIAEGLVP